MWLIAGLGNPGPKYEHTRHNLGARVVEAFRKKSGAPLFQDAPKFQARLSHGTVRLVIPTIFMNESGAAVSALVQLYKTPLDHLIVVHDDKDLAFGEIKLQRARGAAGHHGVESVIQALGSNDFRRLRLGIGEPPPGVETDDFVLQSFTKEETRQIEDSVVPFAVQKITEATAAREES